MTPDQARTIANVIEYISMHFDLERNKQRFCELLETVVTRDELRELRNLISDSVDQKQLTQTIGIVNQRLQQLEQTIHRSTPSPVGKSTTINTSDLELSIVLLNNTLKDLETKCKKQQEQIDGLHVVVNGQERELDEHGDKFLVLQQRMIDLEKTSPINSIEQAPKFTEEYKAKIEGDNKQLIMLTKRVRNIEEFLNDEVALIRQKVETLETVARTDSARVQTHDAYIEDISKLLDKLSKQTNDNRAHLEVLNSIIRKLEKNP